MAGAGVRLFVGLPLPAACQEELARLRAGLTRLCRSFRSRLAWSNPATWHLTLKFIGHAARADLPEIIAALGAVPFAPFDLRPGGGGFFPSPGRPRVVWIGLTQGEAECSDLAGRVDAALAGLGCPAEARPFTPHLTLARVKVPARDPWPELLAAVCRHAWPEVRVDRFVLWKSELAAAGARHVPLALFGPGTPEGATGVEITPEGEREMGAEKEERS